MQSNPSLPAKLANRWMAVGVVFAFLLGLTLVIGFRNIFSPAVNMRSYHVIAASVAVDFAGLCVLLTLLPFRAKFSGAWPWVSAWLQSVLLGSAAFAGMALAPGHTESARTFLSLGLLFAAQSCALAALDGLLSCLLYPAETAARQIVLLSLGAMMTALLWSKGVIRAAEQSSPEFGSQRAELLSDAVMKFSPPLTVSAAWFGESDAALKLTGGRFDIIHAPRTYEQWIGIMGWQVAYADILPPCMKSKSNDSESIFQSPGLALAMFAWGIPMLVLCDVLVRKRKS